jgi:hypothetical protein
MKMHEMGPEARKELGLKAMAHAHKDYDINDVIQKWDESLTGCIQKWKEDRPALWSHTEI